MNSIDFLTRIMDVVQEKREVNSNNIANSNTPGYKASHVKFEELFQNEEGGLALQTTSARHIPIGGSSWHDPMILTDTTSKETPDGNNVDLTKEMTETISINGMQNKAIKGINFNFDVVRSAIGNG